MSGGGGLTDNGVIFEWDPATNIYTKKIDFDLDNGASPTGNLTLKDGKFYGSTSSGGSNGEGVMFEWDPATNIYTKKIDLVAYNGTYLGRLFLKDGKFYGVSGGGGLNSAGVIFEWDPATNVYTKKIDFDITNGSGSNGSLIFSGGRFYGMTAGGGANFSGVLVEWDPESNILTKKIDFGNPFGGNPYGSLTLKDGKLYGMTAIGGSISAGTIFEWDPETNLFIEKIDLAAINGQYAYGALTLNSGKFYGTTALGGENRGGVIFEWDPDANIYTKKVDLSSELGSSPQGDLVAFDISTITTPTVTIAAFNPASSTRCQGAETVTTTTTATNNSAAIFYSLDAASAAFPGNSINSSTGLVTYAAGWSGTTTITASAEGFNGPATTTHLVTTTTKVSPSVNIAVTSGSNPTCSGSFVIFTATPINGGSPSYQWRKGITNVGLNSAIYKDDGLTAGSISVEMTTSLGCVTSPTATSDAIDLTITAPGQWQGVTSDWGTASNWCGGVPTSSTNISIPIGVTQPIIGVSTSASCNNIDIANGATLTIASDETGTGSLIISGTVSGAGSSEVQRYMTTDAWHIVASPVSGQSISNFLISNPNIAANDAGARGMVDYDPTRNNWNKYFTNSTSGNLETGKGFLIRTNANSAVTFAGMLQAGNQTVTFLKPELWNCVGNPYTSAIGINEASSSSDDFLSANASNLDPSFGAIYIWDQPDYNNGVGGLYTIISNVNSGYAVQQGQAFMIKMNTSASSVSFNRDMQLHDPALTLKSTNGIWSTIKLQASVNGQRNSTIIAFNSAMTKGLDPTYDAGLLRGGSDLVIYSKLVEDNGIPFAIQALPDTDFGTMIIPLGVECKTGGEIVFSVENLNLPADCQVILEDKQSHTFTDLARNEYTTTIAANLIVSDRFQLHTSSTSTGVDQEFLAGNVIAFTIRNTEIRIKGRVSNQSVATLYDVQGKVVLVKMLEEGNFNIVPTPNIKTAIYVLTVNDNGKLHRFKIHVNE
jgi:uncharacterized repeat protein (TIGR03803 family)